jgi:hypothetical protein
MPTPTAEKRSWWDDWGDTNDVEECIDPSPVTPPVDPIPTPEEPKYQPLISDFLIFETNKIDIYFIG